MNPLRILITTGDPDGIGWEVTAKALDNIGPVSQVQFVFFRNARHLLRRPGVSKKFRHKMVTTLAEAQAAPLDSRTLIEIRNGDAAAIWVEQAAKACLNRDFQALVTAPLSKTSIIEAGFRDIGHTEILARISGHNNLFMGFVGRHFNVVLVTGHTPLASVPQELSSNKMRLAIAAANELRNGLVSKRRQLPIGLLGVNPHSGEGGLLGVEEKWFRRFIGHDVKGPLVPDSAFLRKNWKLYSVFLCPYHDQGLIPFKLIHGFDSGVHLTLGLPFVRTSVDHGTAKDIFGKNVADFGSMRDAIKMAIRLAKARSIQGGMR